MPLVAEPVSPVRKDVRVLVVEDESRWRDLMVEVIPEMGFAARGARSAEDALQVMEADAYDILLLDLHLPSMNGIDLFKRVKSRWPATQGIILTAYGDLAAAQEAIRLRVAEFLTKPCHLSDIEAALERARQLVVVSRRLASPQQSAPPPGGATLQEAQKQIILDALARHQNNKAAAARELGISRRSLYDRLQ